MDYSGCIYIKGEGYFVPNEIQYYDSQIFGRFPDGTYGFIKKVDGEWKRLPRVPISQ
jgi:hypothetical protein